MSTQPPPPPTPLSSSIAPQKLDFAPLHRTTELENIHAQVIENDLPSSSTTQASSSKRKVLMKHMTVIGDGSDIDNNQMITRQ